MVQLILNSTGYGKNDHLVTKKGDKYTVEFKETHVDKTIDYFSLGLLIENIFGSIFAFNLLELAQYHFNVAVENEKYALNAVWDSQGRPSYGTAIFDGIYDLNVDEKQAIIVIIDNLKNGTAENSIQDLKNLFEQWQDRQAQLTEDEKQQEKEAGLQQQKKQYQQEISNLENIITRLRIDNKQDYFNLLTELKKELSNEGNPQEVYKTIQEFKSYIFNVKKVLLSNLRRISPALIIRYKVKDLKNFVIRDNEHPAIHEKAKMAIAKTYDAAKEKIANGEIFNDENLQTLTLDNIICDFVKEKALAVFKESCNRLEDESLQKTLRKQAEQVDFTNPQKGIDQLNHLLKPYSAEINCYDSSDNDNDIDEICNQALNKFNNYDGSPESPRASKLNQSHSVTNYLSNLIISGWSDNSKTDNKPYTDKNNSSSEELQYKNYIQI